MMLARVTGNVVTTHKYEAMEGWKLLVVRPVDVHGRENKSAEFVVADVSGAGIGETVLIISEGSAAAELLGNKKAPTQHVIAAIVDKINLFKRPPSKVGPFCKGG